MIGFPGLGPSNVVEPNGFTIYGYAKDINTVKEFVENLKERDEFIEGGVYWDKAFSNSVPDIELDQARYGGATTGNSTSTRAGSRGGRGGGRGGGIGPSFGGGGPGGPGGFGGPGGLAARFGGGGMGSRSQPRGTAAWAGEQVTTFHIDLQFLGDPQPQPS